MAICVQEEYYKKILDFARITKTRIFSIYETEPVLLSCQFKYTAGVVTVE